jgi:hypothetical protein
MSKRTSSWVVMLIFITVAGTPLCGQAGDFTLGLNVGTEAGPGGHLHGTFRNFAAELPLSARFSLGYHKSDAGDPFAARRIFINDNTNGTPEDSARYYQARFDLVFPLASLGPQQIYLFGGPRWADYAAEFVYVGGNEDFEVRTSPWGAGVGLETHFAIKPGTDFVLQVGLDHFQTDTLDGHDTAYTPDGDHINPRDGYDYESADEAVNQPRTEILLMMGLQEKM